jgi:hypothetical protein
MTLSYRYDPEQNCIYTRASGTVTTGDILQYIEIILEDKRIKRGFIEIVDFEAVEDLVVTYSEINPFPSIWEKYRQQGCKAVIIYAPNDLSFGTFRMLQTVVLLSHEEDPFIVVRSKEELEARQRELNERPLL